MTKTQLAEPVMQIRIRLDPELSPGSGSEIIVPDPAKIERADKKNFISHFGPVNSGLCIPVPVL